MSEDALTEAPYIGIETAGPRGQVSLRADLADAHVAAAVQKVTGLALPDRLGVTHEGAARAVWMSPDELLLMVPAGEAGAAVATLTSELADRHHMALDVSDARVVFRLTRAGVGEVLAKGAPCDLSDRACPPGTARRTHIAGLAVGLWRLEPEVWEIVCFRSYAHHLEAWLRASAVPGSEVG